MLKGLLSLVAITAILLSCGENENNEVTQKDDSANVSSEALKDDAMESVEHENHDDGYPFDEMEDEIQEQKITYMDDEFPALANSIIQINPMGIFHGDEFSKNDANKKWLGLKKKESGYELSETKITVKTVFDPIADENENNPSGLEVQTADTTCFFLFEKSPLFVEGSLDLIDFNYKNLMPGEKYEFNYLNKTYRFTATGGIDSTYASENYFIPYNYRLFIQEIGSKNPPTLLVAKARFAEAEINLLYGGDFDGDGILDLIIDASSHYNAFEPTLYLSKPSKKTNLMEPVGYHLAVGC